MKKLLYLIGVLFTAAVSITSCGDDGNDWTNYADWRNTNNAWYLNCLDSVNPDGTPYYTQLNPSYLPKAGVLIHYFNDRSKTTGNLQPMLTSRVTVKYRGAYYNNVAFDSTATTGADTVRSFALNGTIIGWQIALADMHVGDTAEVVLPYTMGYGSAGNSSIPPYSALKFGIKLVDIPAYEIP